jgi:TnpA family transposase
VYEHIDALFGEHVVDWELIQTHWQDLFRVVISIQEGKVLPSMLLRKLSNYSRKNRLYQAFRELGCVVRTVFLLQFLSDQKLREVIQSTTNKVEQFNAFSKWLFFGGEGRISDNTPEEQEKRIKYTDLVANCVILNNTVEMSNVLNTLAREGYVMTKDELAALGPYQTQHVKRFGNYEIDLQALPQPITDELLFDIDLPKDDSQTLLDAPTRTPEA